MSLECVPKKKTKRVRLFNLDACGRIIIDDEVPSVLDWDGFETIGFTNKITAGDEETITNTDGDICYDETACPLDKGQDIAFTECTENIVFMALAGFGSLVLATLDIVGFDRESIDCDAAVALEILFATPSLCDDLGNAQCISRLYPRISLFNDNNQRLVNGKNVMRGTYTATSFKNPRVLGNFTTNTPTGELSYLAPWKTGISAGNAFYYDRIVDCPTLEDARSCELRIFNTGA